MHQRCETKKVEDNTQRGFESCGTYQPQHSCPPGKPLVASRGANPTFCVPKRPKAQVLSPPPLPESDRSAYPGSKLAVTVEEEGDLAIHPTASGFAGCSLLHGSSTFWFAEEEIPQFCGSGGAMWASSSVCVFQPRGKDSVQVFKCSSVGPLSSTLTNTYKHSMKLKKKPSSVASRHKAEGIVEYLKNINIKLQSTVPSLGEGTLLACPELTCAHMCSSAARVSTEPNAWRQLKKADTDS